MYSLHTFPNLEKKIELKMSSSKQGIQKKQQESVE